ncbi:MAG: AAA family ATPase [Myxococcota bacterium]|nr:AAA family ATPase [Myxococcota bacterium]
MRRLHASRGATYYLDEHAEGPALVTVVDPPQGGESSRLSVILELENELRMTRDLAVPGIRRAFRRGEIEGRPALWASWLAGDSLEHTFVATRQPLDRVLEIALRITDAIGGLHGARLVHGHLTPDAIRVDAAFREIEISGLGHATRLDVELRASVGAASFPSGGGAAYAAPEQTGRMNRPIDWRTDLYAIGAILYAMLTGRAPFDASDTLELVHRLVATLPSAPHEIAAGVPEALSAIVLKLLAKNAEDRYQSAEGLRVDLAHCLEQWTAGGAIEAFPLGRGDTATRFQLPRKLYGRDAELSALLASFERTSAGATELVLALGPAGAGKTSLVHEVHRPLAARRGRFIEGKFDQYHQNLPFSAFTSAFDAWVHLVLSESDAELERQRARIGEAVGELGGLLTQLVPDLELVIGAQPAVPDVGPSEALNRFQYVLRRFLHAIADETRPLVVFIDDLQWADPASLQLLGTLVSAREVTHLLIVGAYRDGEVSAGHPFQIVLDALERAGAPVHRIEVGPLSEDATEQLVADALGSDAAQVRPLARYVAKETRGNALFVGQLLRSMYEERLLTFNGVTARWEWDLGGDASERGQSRDVLDLIVAKAKRLPDMTREALVRGACLGNRFDVRTLAHVWERSIAETAEALEPAMREGLLLPAGIGHRFVAAGLALTERTQATYVFPHDRIQQAVYSLVPEGERGALHLRIGRLLAASDEATTGARIFEVAGQLNRGRAGATDRDERHRIAALNLEAAMVAKRSGAYAAALAHLEIGVELMGQGAWERDRALALATHTEAAECAYLSTALERMERHIDVVLAHGGTILETIRVYNLRVDAYTSQNRLQDAIVAGLEALAQLGVRFPRAPKLPHILIGLTRTKLTLAGKDVPALAQQRRMTDPHKLEAMLLLERMVPPAYMSGSALFPLLVFAMVDLSVKYGNSPLSAFGYGSFAITLSGVLGDIRSGEVFGKIALETMKNLSAEAYLAKVYFVLYVFIEHWTKHLRESCDPLLDAYQSGMKAGNLVGSTWSAHYRLLWMYFTGAPLAELEREAATYSAIFDQLEQRAAHRRCDMLRQVLLNLMGRTADPIAFAGETYADSEIASLSQKGDDATSRFFYQFNKLSLSYLFGRYEDAVRHGDEARAFLESATGLPDTPFYVFWDALARIAVSERAPKRDAKALLASARAGAKKLAKWGSFGPMNYQHKHDLVAAELARVSGDAASARELYDRAIEGALRHQYVQEAALAQELAARFHRAGGRAELAGWYLSRAHEGYLRWGAIAKADALEAEHPELAHGGARGAVELAGAPASPSIDLASVLKASTAISGEIVLDRLSAKLLEIVVENAGAQRGTLVLYEGGEGRVVAQQDAPHAIVRTGLDEPVRSGAGVPESVLAYVARSKRPLVIDDALTEARFARDPYVVRSRVRSVLCAPILHHGELIGALHLENNLAPSAFTAERVALVNVLGGQIAISLENAKLYQNLTVSLERQVELTSAYSRFTPRAFLDFLGKESILEVKLGDQRHGDMSVVFLDIRSYTSLSEKMSPDDNFRFINGFLRRMTPSIAAHEGVVNSFMGDGVMAFFPRRAEDALAACVEMQRAVSAYNDERRAKGREPIAVGMGVHTGPLMIGVIGDRDRMDTALVSDTVNTAARMEGLTKEFSVAIVASESTVSRIEDAQRYGLRRVGDVRVKGKSHVYRVYECFDGETDESASSKRRTAADFGRGLEAWKAAEFAIASSAFERVLAAHPADRTARRYLERCAEYVARGTPPEWSGVETIDRK